MVFSLPESHCLLSSLTQRLRKVQSNQRNKSRPSSISTCNISTRSLPQTYFHITSLLKSLLLWFSTANCVCAIRTNEFLRSMSLCYLEPNSQSQSLRKQQGENSTNKCGPVFAPSSNTPAMTEKISGGTARKSFLPLRPLRVSSDHFRPSFSNMQRCLEYLALSATGARDAMAVLLSLERAITSSLNICFCGTLISHVSGISTFSMKTAIHKAPTGKNTSQWARCRPNLISHIPFSPALSSPLKATASKPSVNTARKISLPSRRPPCSSARQFSSYT